MDKTTPITLIANCKYGLEKTVKFELQNLGITELTVSPGQISFAATVADIPRLNLWLRVADRLRLKMGQFHATTFEEIFEQTKAISWESWVTHDGQFTVNAKAVRSQILSERSTQSIVKKAVVDRLKEFYGIEWFEEDGPKFTIEASILNDTVTLSIDTSGSGLHKRGYRIEAGEAPLKETLAAGLVQLSFWQKNRRLLDPMCGAGTILIEAAMIARNIAPGLKRSFASEAWPGIGIQLWRDARKEAEAAIIPWENPQIFGYDIDPDLIEIARRNAARAGVESDIVFETKELKELWIDREYGIVITNPPYGLRLSDFHMMNDLYINLHKSFRKKKGWSVYVFTADYKFPDYFKRARPDRVRKLYNGPIEANYYQYYGEKPSN